MTGFLNITKLLIPHQCIDDAYEHLRAVGRKRLEGVCLFAGRADKTSFNVVATIIPRQTLYRVEEGLLYAVDGDELHQINVWLYQNKLQLIAQIHSHPTEAYHSETDDVYPIVAALGGVSIVVPDFANAPFSLDKWAIYRLLPETGWTKLTVEQTANFLDKAALSASQVLKEFDRSEFEKILLSHNILIAFDEHAATKEGLATLDMCIRLTARLYPYIQITDLSGKCQDVAESLSSLAQQINPVIEINSSKRTTVCVVVGKTPISSDVPVFYLGSRGWIAKLSQKKPIGSGSTNNPFGAGAAACFGAANLFRYVFQDQLPYGTLDPSLSLSLLDYGIKTKHNPQLGKINLGSFCLVGIGAIGNGVIWALSKLDSVDGSLDIIDGEPVSLSNLQRYILTIQDDREMQKVVVAQKAIVATQLKVNPFPMHWETYLNQRGNWNIDLAVVAVDSAIDRIGIQTSLPRHILNAWTQRDNLGVSRHMDFINYPCLACLYIPRGEHKSYSQQVADHLKVPHLEYEVIRKHLSEDIPVNDSLLIAIAEANSVSITEIQKYLGQPLEVLYSDLVCGGEVLKITGDDSKVREVKAPLAFQSALAGIMLAAEIVAIKGNLRKQPLPTITGMNLLRPLGEYLSEDEPKNVTDTCICGDKDYQQVYIEKYLS